jgi:hypothetical protein
VDHIDSIVILESKFSELTTQIGDLNEAIKEVDKEKKELIEEEKQSEVQKIYCDNEVKECVILNGARSGSLVTLTEQSSESAFLSARNRAN